MGAKSETTCAKTCFSIIHPEAGMRPTHTDDRGRILVECTAALRRAVGFLYRTNSVLLGESPSAQRLF